MFCFLNRKKRSTVKLNLFREQVFVFVFLGGAGGGGLATVLKIVQGNKIVEQNNSIFSRI